MTAVPGPEASPRLRALFIAIMLLNIVACGRQHNEPDPVLLRPSLERAVLTLRPQRPHAAAAVEELWQEAEVASAAAAAAPRWRRRTEAPAVAWARVVTEAARATTEFARFTDAATRRWEQSRDGADLVVQAAHAKLHSPGMGLDEAEAASRARVLLQSAHRLAAAGQWERAAELADHAAEVSALVEQRWHDEHRRYTDPQQLAAWRQVVDDTLAWTARTHSGAIIVDKLERRLLLLHVGRIAFEAAAEIGANGLRRKRHAGDRATPEGSYRITAMKQGSSTRYSKALLIDYPNREDLLRFHAEQAAGKVPRGVGPGHLIEIHGGGGSGRDWTDGCVALPDEAMDRLFERVAVGTPVVIVGTVGSPLPRDEAP